MLKIWDLSHLNMKTWDLLGKCLYIWQKWFIIFLLKNKQANPAPDEKKKRKNVTHYTKKVTK